MSKAPFKFLPLARTLVEMIARFGVEDELEGYEPVGERPREVAPAQVRDGHYYVRRGKGQGTCYICVGGCWWLGWGDFDRVPAHPGDKRMAALRSLPLACLSLTMQRLVAYWNEQARKRERYVEVAIMVQSGR